MDSSEASRAIEVDGRRLGLRSIGRGPALLLVNGYAATAADWDPQLLSALGRSFELLCPDNRGVGASTLGDPAELTVDAMAADLETLLDALEIERVPVAGWSMGGFVAQRLAARAPTRVEALVLLSTDPGGSAAARCEPRVWALLTDHSGTPREQASRLISLLFPPVCRRRSTGASGRSWRPRAPSSRLARCAPRRRRWAPGTSRTNPGPPLAAHESLPPAARARVWRSSPNASVKS